MIDGITILNNVTVSDFNPIPWLGVFIGLTVAYIIIYIKYDKFDKKDVRGVWYAIFGITLILLIADIRFSKVDAIQCTIEDYVSINEVYDKYDIADKEFTLEDFSCEHLISDEAIPCRVYSAKSMMEATVNNLNTFRKLYLETQDKKYWWQMIQLLPSSYNQRRTVMLNYEVIANIYKSRKNHKLDEWSFGFIEWILSLPYSELITGGTING